MKDKSTSMAFRRRTGLRTETCLSTGRPALAAMFAAGALTAALPANATNFVVEHDYQLTDAIDRAQDGDTIVLARSLTNVERLPPITKNLTIDGAGYTIQGVSRGSREPAGTNLFVMSGTVVIRNLTMSGNVTQGGKGGDGVVTARDSLGSGGGGGAGLGGALFVGRAANVTLSNVNFLGNKTIGGDGGSVSYNPSSSEDASRGGGGGYEPNGDGQAGDSRFHDGRGGAGNGGNAHFTEGSPGLFGGGGGGGGGREGGMGGFGGGRGGGMPYVTDWRDGGFGGGASDRKVGGGGGGFGGAIFVQNGGTLTLKGSLDVAGNAADPGISGGSPDGKYGGIGGESARSESGAGGFGSGIFLHGSGTLDFAPSGLEVQAISDSIVDQKGVSPDGRFLESGGSWSLVKSGDGTTILSGSNAYSGGTTITGGVLRILNADALGSSSVGVTVSNGGALEIGNRINIGTRPLTINGTGVANGGALRNIADSNQIRGPITLGSDARINSDAGILYVQGIAGPHSLTLGGAGNISVSGSVDITGTLTKDGDGNVILSRASPGIGRTVISQGILTILNGKALGEASGASAIVAAGATLAIDNNIHVGLNHLILNGTGAGNLGALRSFGTNTFNGPITLGSNTRVDSDTETLTLSGGIAGDHRLTVGGGGNTLISGDIAINALTKDGSGKLILSGNNVVDLTTLDAGGLSVNGKLSTRSVILRGGVLSGVGNIEGALKQEGGAIAPGNSIGTITINGDLTINRGTLEIEVNAQGASDRIRVVGADHKATINARTLLIVPEAGTYTPNTTYTIITTEGGGAVQFDEVVGGVGFLTPRVSLDREHIYVTLALAPNAFRSAGQTVNQQAVGGALDTLAASGSVGGIVTTMANLSVAQGGAALQALSGQPYADFGTLNTRASQLFMNAVGRQMATNRGAGLGGTKSVALAEACDVACDASQPSRFGAWVAGIGSTGSVLGDANASGFTYTMGGTAFGVDYRPDPRFLVGIAGGYTSGTQWVNGFSGNGYSDAFSVALYGSFTQNGTGPGFYADALAGYANASNRLQRVIALPGSPTGIANGNTSANQFLGQIETGYKIGLGIGANSSISPFARLQVGSINQAGFTEYGGGLFNLAVAAQTTTSVRTTFGVDLAGGFEVGGTLLDLGFRLGWMHEFADTARPMTAAFAAAPTSQFTVFGATPQRDSAVVGFSAATAIGDRTSLFVSYDGEIGGGTDNHALRAGFRITW